MFHFKKNKQLSKNRKPWDEHNRTAYSQGMGFTRYPDYKRYRPIINAHDFYVSTDFNDCKKHKSPGSYTHTGARVGMVVGIVAAILFAVFTGGIGLVAGSLIVTMGEVVGGLIGAGIGYLMGKLKTDDSQCDTCHLSNNPYNFHNQKQVELQSINDSKGHVDDVTPSVGIVQNTL